MDMQPVKSSNIEAIGYDAPSAVLRVKFLRSAAYDYADVSPVSWAQLQTADSVGSYIARHIKPHHKATKVVE